MDSTGTQKRLATDSAVADDSELERVALMTAVRKIDRRKVLTMIGHPRPDVIPVGDVLLLSPLLLPDKLEVERRDVPWLHAGAGYHCEGAKLYRFNRRLVTVPCFASPQAHGICCSSCHEIFGQVIEDDDTFHVVKARAPHSAARYKPGAGVAFWRIPSIVKSIEAFESALERVEATSKKFSLPKPESWPPSFKDFIRDVFVAAGVVWHNSISFEGRRGRSYPRSEWDEKLLGELADNLVPTWLQLRWLLAPDRFERAVDDLTENANKWETSVVNCVQAAFPLDPVFRGPSNAADFLCAGFAHAASWVNNYFAQKDADPDAPIPPFSWGTGVDVGITWALEITEYKRPDRRARHKAFGPPSLPNDFLLSGSTMVDSQSTTGFADAQSTAEIESSQDSVFTAPPQFSQSEPAKPAAESATTIGFFIVVDGPDREGFSKIRL